MKRYNSFNDWIPFMEGVIRDRGVKTVLEFGMGEGTQTLLDLCEKVVSVELQAIPELGEWYDKCHELYSENPGWKSYLYKCKDEMNSMTRLYCGNTIKRIKPDLVFVDPGVHFRGDLVNLCMQNRVKLIVAHDTKQGFAEDDIYGWNKIDPEGYTSHTDNQIQGTTLWVKND